MEKGRNTKRGGAPVRTTLVGRRHAWTGADVPWRIDDIDDAPGAEATVEAKTRRRLFRYLSGGGLSVFGTSSARLLVERRQARFLRIACALAALWLFFWII